MKADVKTIDAKSAGSIDLDDDLFGLKPRKDILHRMVRYQLAKRQSGNHAAKDRSLVNGSMAKIHNQKGTGRARASTKKAPQFRGGGKAFGPVTRSHAIKLPKKFRALALRHALSAKVTANELIVLDSTANGAAKTSELRKKLAKLDAKSALIIDGPEVDEKFGRSARNIPNVDVLPVQGINVYDILRRDKLVLTKAAIEALEARYK